MESPPPSKITVVVAMMNFAKVASRSGEMFEPVEKKSTQVSIDSLAMMKTIVISCDAQYGSLNRLVGTLLRVESSIKSLGTRFNLYASR